MSALREALRDLPDAVFADLLESEDAYLLVVDLPGVSRETVDVTVEDRQVRIEARREKDLPPEFRYVREDRSLFLDAEIPLPPDAEDGAEASMDRGVLTLRVGKRGDDVGTRIEIRDEDGPDAEGGDDRPSEGDHGADADPVEGEDAPGAGDDADHDAGAGSDDGDGTAEGGAE